MPPPPNTTAATALAITSLPYSTTQQADFAGTTYDLWYRWTCPECVELIGIAPYGDATLYKPRIQVYVGPPSAPLLHYNDSGNNQPAQVPVDAGTEYFLKFRTSSPTAAPATLTFSIYAGPNVRAPAGSIVVADDTPGYPATVIDATTGVVLRAPHPFPAGEEGDSLPSGVMLFHDTYGDDTFKLFNAQFALIASIPPLGTRFGAVRATPGANVFVVADGGSGGSGVFATIGTVSATGVLGATTWTIPPGPNQLSRFVADNTLAILYYALLDTSEVRRWDLVADAVLGSLVAALAGYGAADMLMLADGTLVVLYQSSSPRHVMAKRYDAAGATRNTYEFGADHSSLSSRLGYSLSPGAFWIYTHPAAVPGRYYGVLTEVRASDGVTLSTLTVPESVAGAYEPPVTSAALVPFGVSPSCPIFPLRQTLYACGEEPPVPPPDHSCSTPLPIPDEPPGGSCAAPFFDPDSDETWT